MQQFINWGGETPEQIAERRRFEEEMREFMINKMLMEAALNQSKASSATAAVGGGGGGQVQVEVTSKTGIITYYNTATEAYEFFTMNPASLTFSPVVSLANYVTPGQTNRTDVYIVNESGYVIIFQNSDNSRTMIFVSPNGEILDSVTTVPTYDINYGLANGKIFYASDYDDKKIWLFDGTTLRLDASILVDATSLTLGSSRDWSTGDGRLIVQVSKNDPERGDYREWWAASVVDSVLLLPDYYAESGVNAILYASHTSNYIVVEAYSIETNALYAKGIINTSAELFWNETVEPIVYNENIFYGTDDLVLSVYQTETHYKFRFFDPASPEVQVIDWEKPNQDAQYQISYDSAYSASTYANTPPNSIAITLFVNMNNGINGNLTEVNNLNVVTKFKGQPATITDLSEITYANIYNLRISNDVALLPVSTDGTTYKILKGTKSSNFENFVDNVEYQISGLDAVSFDRVANGFLLEVADASQESSFIHFINNLGESPVSSIFALPGENYNNNSNWYDESGPILYYSHGALRAWLPDLAEWRLIGSSVVERYSTRNYSNPDYLDGSNYLLISQGPRLYWFTDEGSSNVDDGGNDMYDGGNELYGGSQESQITYTHTQISNGNYDEITDANAYVMDGSVQSGAGFSLGQASEYFTNCYPGLFVMAAMGVETDQFAIYGNLGADGGGQVDAGKIDLAEAGYNLFYKRVWGAGDPSVNQLIIVKATDNSQINQTYDSSSQDDDHVLQNLDSAGVTQIHYLLFALAGGNQASIEDITALANAYVALVKTENNATDVLEKVNLGYDNLLTNIPAHVPTNGSIGTIVSKSSLTNFNIPSVEFDTVLLGTNGVLMVVPNSNSAFDILHFNLAGRLVSRVETDLYSVQDTSYVDDRAIIVLGKEGGDGWDNTVYIFNENGYSQTSFSPSGEGFWLTLNDIVWWD